LNYSQIAILLTQGVFVALVILFLFHFRKQLGIGVMFACLGLFQFVQVFLYSTVSVSITNNFFVSPGSAVFFTASLFVLLMVYIKEDTRETKKIIYALFTVNIVMTILVQILNLHFNNSSIEGTFSLSTNLFKVSLWELFIGAIVLFLDAFLIIILFEYISKKIRFLFLHICITMLLVVSFDTLFFCTLNFWDLDNLESIIISGLISKGVFTIFYSILLYIYLKYFDKTKPLTTIFKIKDIFQPLTYRQKFESAEKVIKETTEMYRILTEHSSDLILLQEPDSSFKYISPSIKKILGYEQSEFIGKTVFSVVHKDDAKFIKNALSKKMFIKGVFSDAIPFRIRHKKGHYIWLEFLSTPVYTDGKINYFVTSARDITQRVLAKQKIQMSLKQLEIKESSLSVASEMAKIGYWSYSTENESFTWSDYMYTIYGIDPKNGIPSQKELMSFYDKESVKKIEQVIKEISVKGVSCDVELRFINLNNEVVWERTVAQSVYNEQGEITGRIGVMQDITAFKKAQLEQELSKQKIQSSLNLLEKRDYSLRESSRVAKIGYWEYDILSDTFIWSDYVYEIYGFDLKDNIPSRKEMVAFYDKESQKKLAEATLNLNLKEIPYDIELQLINNKQKEVWVRNVVHLIYNEQKEIVGRRGVVHNITASKKAQIELELSKQKIQTSLKMLEKSKYSMEEASKIAKIGYWEHDLLSDSVVLSEYVHRIFGLSLKNMAPLRSQILKSFNKESREKLEAAAIALITNGTSYDIELKFLNKQNEILWIRNVAQPVYDDQNKIIGKRGIVQNITVSKKVQQELEQSKKEVEGALELLEKKEYSLRKASEIAKIGYQEYDSLTDTFTWSDYVYDILRFDINEGVPTREAVTSIFDDESLKIYEQSTLELISNGTPFDHELRFISPNKEEVWVRNVVHPVYDQQNNIIGRRGVLQDITIAKKAKFELELSKKNIQASLELLEKSEHSKNEASKMAKIGHLDYDIATDTFVWSEYLYYIFGLDPKLPVPPLKEIISFLDKDSQKKMKEVTLDLELNGVSYDIEIKLINKRNEEVWGRMIVQPLFNNQKQVVGRRGVFQNITERKKIEEEHLRIKDNYRRLFDNATVSIWNEDLTLLFKQIEIIKKQNVPNIKIYLEQYPQVLASLLDQMKVNSVNEATLKLYKVKNYQKFLLNIQDTFGTGAEKVFINLVEAIWNNEKIFSSEVNFKTLEGDEFAALFSVPIPQTLSEQKTVPVSIQSIQNIKEAELAKKESLNKLKEAQELAQVGSWSFNFITKESEWSEQTYRIWGFDLDKKMPSQVEIYNRIHKEDQEYFDEIVASVFKDRTPYDIEFRICLPNNVVKTIRSICKPMFDENGEVVYLKGTNQDITEQKRIRKKIEEAEEMYRILTDNSNDLICLQEPDSTFMYISPSIKSLLGYEQSEFLGKQVFSIVHKDDVVDLKEAMKRRVFSGLSRDAFSFRVYHKEGHYVWLEFLSSPVYKDKVISYYVTSARDITQWVLAKQEIEEYQTSLQKLTTEMTLIEEKQKQEIATNIHDHLSQSLVISKMKINELKKESKLKFIEEDLKFIETHISEALENSRKITYELSPPVLYQLGIIEALNWLFDNVETKHKIACVVNSNVDGIYLDEVKSILLYRSIQEVLTNAIKYANASLITLDLDKNKLGLDILITDNGVGFDTSILNNLHNRSGSGFGLFSVQERIRNIQGEISIKSKINIGTTVNFFIPLSE